MEGTFVPRLDVLPPPQRRLWPELPAVPEGFVLYGGTAIALHLGHRQSVDFDFFADRPIDADELLLFLPFLAGATVTHIEPNTLTCIADRQGPVKLSFFGLPRLPRLRPPLRASDTGLRVASLLDLAGTKASVVQRRAEAKDYLDLDAILRDGRIDLPAALAAAQVLYGERFNPVITLKALTWFEEGDLGAVPRVVRRRLAAAVRAVDPGRLPPITPSPR